MQDVDLEGPAVELVGALGLDRTDTGISPRRLPDWTRSQLPDPFMDIIIRMTSGVRLRFATDSTVVELDVLLGQFRFLPLPLPPTTFDLVVDGGPASTVATTDGIVVTLDLSDPTYFDFEAGEPTTIRFEGLAPSTKVVEVWLPHRATVELQALRVDDGAVVVPAPPPGIPRWLHYGSSISHCIEASSPTATWPAVAARLGNVDLRSLGLAGQCMLDPFVARTIRDEPADLISIKVGINLVNGDTMRERTFGPALHGFLDTVREGHPATPILLVSPIFCPSAETSPGPTVPGPDGRFATFPGMEDLRATCLTLTKIRTTIAATVETRRDLGDSNLGYLDGLRLFSADDEADLPDALHPNAEGYVRIGERFAALAFGPEGLLHPAPV